MAKKVDTSIAGRLKQTVTTTAPVVPPTAAAPGAKAPSQMAEDTDVLAGGVGDKVDYDKLNKKQLEMGTKIEMEHTNNPDVAKEIAGDHLSEQLEGGKEKKDQDYYTELKKIDKHESVRSRPLSKRSYWLGGGGPNEPSPGKPKYKPDDADPVEPRGDGEELQNFWKRNYDYGESPYMNMDDVEKITDTKKHLYNDGRFDKNKKK